MDNDEQRAKEALMELAKRRVKSTDADNKLEMSLKQLGITPEHLKYAGGAAKIADSIANERLQLDTDITDNLKLQTDISPKEKALKLLYKKDF